MTIILDMGGVLMNHNMPECIARFTDILGEEHMKTILGLATNGEGTADSLMERYERGDISTETFIDGILQHAQRPTSREEIIAAWNAMHGGIPAERLQLIQSWKDAGHRLFLLSNTNAVHWEEGRKRFDYRGHRAEDFFERIFLSHEIHELKPTPEAFLKVAQLAGIEPTETLFVDDLEVSCKAAEALGFKTYCPVPNTDWRGKLRIE
jgi:putative hydrolase of the HAD superfamily